MILSIVSININITEGFNHSSVIRATWQEKRKKKGRFACFHFHLLAKLFDIEKVPLRASINTRDRWQLNAESPSTAWENSSIDDDRVNGKRKHGNSGETKSRITTQSPRDAIRVSSLEASAYRGRAAESRGIPSERALCLPIYLRLFTLPRPFVSRRAFRAGDRDPRPRVASRGRKDGSGWALRILSRFPFSRGCRCTAK